MIERSICFFKTVREGRLKVIREEDRVHDVKGMKEESGGKKVDQF